MYHVGEYVICRSGGVWCISAINGFQLTLTRYNSAQTKQLCVGDTDLVRSITDKATILEVIDRIGFIPAIQASGDKARKYLYDAAMAKFDEIEWVKIIKTVYLRQKARTLFSSELAYYETAKCYLHSEISILLEIPFSEVETYIANTISDDLW